MSSEFLWPVVPICEKQRRDVNPADLLQGGLYRKCSTYKAGGGYDKFPSIYQKRIGMRSYLGEQFVVQLQGCSLNCPYCYVTRDGVLGQPVMVSTSQLVEDFKHSGCGVFHLMGGAPALYLQHWKELLDALGEVPFHSDFVLNEMDYPITTLKEIAAYKNGLYAVSVKGADEVEYLSATGTGVKMAGLLNNLRKLYLAGINFYVTFTGMSEESVQKFKAQALASLPESVMDDGFSIQLVKYEALK